MKKHRFFNMYLTTTISVALVLFLVGLECIVLLSARNLITRVKENLALTVVLTEEADSTSLARFATMMDAAPYCHDYKLITKEQALREHIEQLGEDPSAFLGYNPLTDAFEVRNESDYDDFFVIAKQDVEQQIEDAIFFLKSIEAYLADRNAVPTYKTKYFDL